MEEGEEETVYFDDFDEWRGAKAHDMRPGGSNMVLTGCQATCSIEHLRILATKPFICCGFIARLFNYGSLESLASDDLMGLKAKLQDAVVKDPYDKESWNNLGRVLHLFGDREGCLQCFEEAIRIDPKDPSLLHNAGVAAESFKSFEKAERFYAKAVKVQSDFVPARINRAMLLLHLFNDVVQPIKDLNEVFEHLNMKLTYLIIRFWNF
ncbi:hypothetical protein GUITHDRAFT_109169 [Guillardia theta CCMP2712]|uniref:Uncharacterized protein n=1 Tax=Guillardia theta (strain CCMP2712) TaxID=905079 RepID=L1JAJ4_GUITC|nr:hypothetical protein GUITHDRAFT_109169 [Guillardia theta CCMP2712]EKX45124.1 hypothetical protein GUITHDRAFT_109169 [Guillardia theta CCMP2712]|eukprot:XP_005832104.1 hypothetical protein GUITHDRAFT_109169 [Guillardia theta CCMP2712]